MNFSIDSQNYVRIDKESARIIELKLLGRVIIQQISRDLGSGSYLMYPWVNRVEKNPYTDKESPFKDGNGIPLHGFYINQQRQITISSPKENTISIECKPILTLPNTPSFKQTLTLSKGKLTIAFSLLQQPKDIPVCFGYHPYLQIDQQDLKDMKISTDIKTQLTLQESLLTRYPYQKQQTSITVGEKYDSLFEGGTYFQLSDQSGFSVRLSSDLPFWQIYTPPDGKRIAVQPMSFTGNLYKIHQIEPKPIPTKGSLTIQVKNGN